MEMPLPPPSRKLSGRHESPGRVLRASDRGQEVGICIWRRVRIAGENEAIFLRQVCVVVAQVQIEHLAGQRHACIPIEIGGQREAA